MGYRIKKKNEKPRLDNNTPEEEEITTIVIFGRLRLYGKSQKEPS